MDRDNFNNRQKFWLSFIAILMIGLWFISFEIKTAWINSPTTFTTHHDINFNGDEYVSDSLDSIARITESQEHGCIVKEYEWVQTVDPYYVDETYNNRYLVNEYVSENCTMVGE